MLKTLQEVSQMIVSGKWLHVGGSEKLLRQLPRGKWIGGSIEYFMDSDGGIVTDEKLFVTELSYPECKITSYDAENIHQIADDAYDNGFSIVIMPFGSKVRDIYSLNAPEFPNMFLKPITGWVSGTNLSASDQIAMVVNGETGEYFNDRAVTLHICLPEGKIANIGIINIFSADESSPIIEFFENSPVIDKCLIGGEEVVFAEYIRKHNIDIQIPIIGEYFGSEVNVSLFKIENDVVTLGAPAFAGIKYRFGRAVSDYPKAFMEALKPFQGIEAAFACNCVFNFLFGALEGKRVDGFYGPMSFGEIAYQLLNQTLVYVLIT